MYNINQKNRYTPTPKERRKKILQAIWIMLSRTVIILLVLFGLMLLTLLIVIGIQYLMGGS